MDTGKPISIPITSGWQGYALTAAIIAIRAFQPGAEPMSEWSWWSWLLMAIPTIFPLAIWTAFGSLWLLTSAMTLLVKALGRKC